MPTAGVDATIPAASLKFTTTTVFLVRHADAPTGPDPHLYELGIARSRDLARVLGEAGISGIYASEYLRTQETAQPLASLLGLSIDATSAADSGTLVRRIRRAHRGHNVLVVGHSNTVPEIIAGFGGPPVADIAHTQFDRMFVLTLTQLRTRKVAAGTISVRFPERETCTLLTMRYGAPT